MSKEIPDWLNQETKKKLEHVFKEYTPQEIKESVIAVGEMQLAAFQRMEELARLDNDSRVLDSLSRLQFDYQNPKTHTMGKMAADLDTVRRFLIRHIREGVGRARIQTPKEVVPWDGGRRAAYHIHLNAVMSNQAGELFRAHIRLARELSALDAGDHDSYAARWKSLSADEQEGVIFVNDQLHVGHCHDVLRQLFENNQPIQDPRKKKTMKRGLFWEAFENRQKPRES